MDSIVFLRTVIEHIDSFKSVTGGLLFDSVDMFLIRAQGTISFARAVPAVVSLSVCSLAWDLARLGDNDAVDQACQQKAGSSILPNCACYCCQEPALWRGQTSQEHDTATNNAQSFH
ncbi:hypothetical protein ElyMa_006041900 [Elysia marginata]|uniref:Uncharacterized protein n=1 Tax=Elysia marginata TaxID=1093978 RepID=A0AAV4GMW7_9GAST|nr:hypothetical protein ElyMa_006041900 [Elysia marginata]